MAEKESETGGKIIIDIMTELAEVSDNTLNGLVQKVQSLLGVESPRIHGDGSPDHFLKSNTLI